MIGRKNSKLHYINPLELHILYSSIITFDNNFILEQCETSDNRPNITTTGTFDTPTTFNDTNILIDDQNELISDQMHLTNKIHNKIQKQHTH